MNIEDIRKIPITDFLARMDMSRRPGKGMNGGIPPLIGKNGHRRSG